MKIYATPEPEENYNLIRLQQNLAMEHLEETKKQRNWKDTAERLLSNTNIAKKCMRLAIHYAKYSCKITEIEDAIKFATIIEEKDIALLLKDMDKIEWKMINRIARLVAYKDESNLSQNQGEGPTTRSASRG